MQKVAVIGGGLMGAGWTALFLARGFQVSVASPAPHSEEFVRAYVKNGWNTLEQLEEVLPGADPDRMTFTKETKVAVADAMFVQENAPEELSLKRELYREIDSLTPPEVLIASSSSGLRMTDIQTGCRHPERTVTGHPFNPAHLVPLVEVIGGERTAPETIERAMDFYASLNKRPILLRKEIPGHIGNRLQAALWREAVHLVAEGVASVADVDAAITHGPGLRFPVVGPHMNLHLAGGDGGIERFMENLLGPMMTWWAALGSPEMTPELQAAIVDGVHAAAKGRTSSEIAEERDRWLVTVRETLLKFRSTTANEPTTS